MYAYHVESGRIVDGNWPAAVGGWYGYIAAGPVLADLDGDGDSEILVALDLESADTDGLIAMQGDGTYLWQRRYTAQGPISVADMDRDGDVEIALCGLGPGLSRVYTFILDHKGQQVARWRGGSPKGTAFADLDGDGKTEMVFCTEEEVMAVRADGSTVWKTKHGRPAGHRRRPVRRRPRRRRPGEVYVNTLRRGRRIHLHPGLRLRPQGQADDRRRVSQDDHGRPDAVRPADRGHRRRRSRKS